MFLGSTAFPLREMTVLLTNSFAVLFAYEKRRRKSLSPEVKQLQNLFCTSDLPVLYLSSKPEMQMWEAGTASLSPFMDLFFALGVCSVTCFLSSMNKPPLGPLDMEMS